MSRHRNVRNLDYDEILDDEAAEDEITPEDNAQWERSVDEITRRLGSSDFQVADVRDAAWHYYFDVDKATNYLLQKRTSEAAKAKKAAAAAEAASGKPPGKHLLEESSTPAAADSVQTGATMDRAVGPDAQPPPKKLSKIQQLALERAARKNAAKAAPAEKPAQSRAIEPERVAPVATDLARPEDEMQIDQRQDDQKEVPEVDARLDLAAPSAFAQTIAGVHEPPKPESHADMLFAVTGKPQGPSLGISFAKPSPDDVVQQAQSKSKGMKAAKEELAKVDVAEPAQKTILPLEPRQGRPANSQTREVSLVVVGHVDAGKSTLFGRLLYDIGQIDERSMSKLKKESESINKASFAFAWAMDSSAEERARGVTIDFAQNSFSSGDTTFNILDAPGHKDFVPNMIAGASQADLAVLVIDASRGAFESGFEQGGQTKEHAILIRALGIQNVLVAVNKLDSVDWSRERFIDIETQLSVFLKTTGFDPGAITYVPCSGLTGENVIQPAGAQLRTWYKGSSLLDAMKTAAPVNKDATKPFRMLLSDVHPTANSSATTVSGRVSSGEVQQGDQILCMPSKETATVKTLMAGDRTDAAFAGDNVILTLSDIDPMYLRSGDVICHTQDPVANAQWLTARIVTFQILQPLLRGSSLVLHRGRLDVPVVIRSIRSPIKDSTEFKTARHVLRNAQAVVELELRNGTIPIEPFAANKDVGRVILRREGATVAAGVVLSAE